jgi:hypothetical protein
MLKNSVILGFALFFHAWAYGQNKVTTVGIQLKPIFGASLFGTGPVEIDDGGFAYTIRQNTGFSGGMIIRKGFEKNVSLEFGINYCRRNFGVQSQLADTTSNLQFTVIGYEIPVSGLFFVRLSERWFMNVSGGFCLNMFPSDVQKANQFLLVYAGRPSGINPSLIANVGAEYRSEKSGYFYVGCSLNRPFSPIYKSVIDYVINNQVVHNAFADLRGAYLTIDFRYFFHEDPARKKAKLPGENRRRE